MTQEQLKWLLVMVSNAPITNLAEARFKAYWLLEIVERLENDDSEK